jgi:ADP-heptose:LPS heptosyltransferase
VIPKNIIVFRFSALGDIAMTVPVLWNLRQRYPDCKVLFVSRPFAKYLIAPLDGIEFFSVDFKGEYKGLAGIFKLFGKLCQMHKWDLIVDLHDVLRTKILRLLFRLKGVRSAVINKGRGEKKALCKRSGKILVPLTTTIERYRMVFEAGGLSFKFADFPGRNIYVPVESQIAQKIASIKSPKIGIAPFAKHIWKMWDESKVIELISMLEQKGCSVFLFGGRGDEAHKLETWATASDCIHNLAGKLNMREELEAMSELDVMVSMDSANMHLASLVGTHVVSIWGATHPYAGFYGWNQNPENAVQVELKCRPCSIFGNKPCYRGDFACMMGVTMEMVSAKIDIHANVLSS